MIAVAPTRAGFLPALLQELLWLLSSSSVDLWASSAGGSYAGGRRDLAAYLGSKCCMDMWAVFWRD